MIASSRVDLAKSEALLADGMTAWFRGDEGPSAVAAGRIVAETVLMWRIILESKINRSG